MPRLRVRVVNRVALHGGLLLRHSVHQYGAGAVPLGILLPCWHRSGHGVPVPRGHLLAGRAHVCRRGLVLVMLRGLLPRSSEHNERRDAVRGGLLLLFRNSQHAAGDVPCRLLLPLGHWRGHG